MKKKKTRNAFEKSLERQLKKAKVPHKYEAERIPYHWVGHYIPDFSGVRGTTKWIIEAKGYFRIDAKRKMVAVKRLNPTLDIRIVFYKYKAADVKWAVKNGFPYAIGKIPEEWIEELKNA